MDGTCYITISCDLYHEFCRSLASRNPTMSSWNPHRSHQVDNLYLSWAWFVAFITCYCTSSPSFEICTIYSTHLQYCNKIQLLWYNSLVISEFMIVSWLITSHLAEPAEMYNFRPRQVLCLAYLICISCEACICLPSETCLEVCYLYRFRIVWADCGCWNPEIKLQHVFPTEDRPRLPAVSSIQTPLGAFTSICYCLI